MIIITSFAISENFDFVPTKKALQKNINNKAIQKIYVLTESKARDIFKIMVDLDISKIHVIEKKNRPRISELFDFASRQFEKTGLCVAITNSDTAFSTTLDVHKVEQILKMKNKCHEKSIITLSRKDIVNGKWETTLYDESGFPNLMSVDCWAFFQSIYIPQCQYLSLGYMNCDMLLNNEFVKMGYEIINPSLDVILEHYEDIVKSNEFYHIQNNTELAQQNLHIYWNINAMPPYQAYGAPWTTSRLILNGYKPKAFDINISNKLFISLDNTLDRENYIHLYIAEIFAKLNNYKLILVFENNTFFNENLLLSIKGNETYLLPVISINYFEKKIFGKLLCGVKSCAFVSYFVIKTESLKNYYDHIYMQEKSLMNQCLPYQWLEKYNLIMKSRYGCIIDNKHVKNDGLCTLITSAYKSDKYLLGFTKNICSCNLYGKKIFHICIVSKLSKEELQVLIEWFTNYEFSLLLWKDEDPGLYACWNIGLQIAETNYVSNANVDDLRHPDHIITLCTILENNPHISIASSTIVPFEKYTDEYLSLQNNNAWYQDQTGPFSFQNLGYLEKVDGTWSIRPNNLPHCMPVWRKELHSIYGYFDEKRFGTFADWAFWLKVTKAGEQGYLHNDPLSYYYINTNSHNRKSKKLSMYHQEVEKEFLPDFFFMYNQQKIPPSVLSIYNKHQIEFCVNNSKLESKCEYTKKLCITGRNQVFGQHRNSFNKIIKTLEPLHIGDLGILLIPFIERYFVWGNEDGEAASLSPRPIKKPWVGILHVPFDAPSWFESSVYPENIFKTHLWNDSLPYCKGIILLSLDIERDFLCFYPKIPTLHLYHPTELNVKKFNFSEYKKNKKIVQIGNWLRKLQYIYQVDAYNHQKIILIKKNTKIFMQRDVDTNGDFRNYTVTEYQNLNDEDYDKLLTNSLVLSFFYATSSNNVILECMARNTPLITNPLPSVVEYLGKDYPLYCEDIRQASDMISDLNRIYDTHLYLKFINKNKFSYKSFQENLINSIFYENL